jgi:hypothetical protein
MWQTPTAIYQIYNQIEMRRREPSSVFGVLISEWDIRNPRTTQNPVENDKAMSIASGKKNSFFELPRYGIFGRTTVSMTYVEEI